MKQLKMFMMVAFFAVIAVACGEASKKPDAVAIEFMEALSKGDSKKLLDLVYISEEDNNPETKAMVEGKLGMMAGMVKAEMDSKGGIKEIKADSVEYNDDKSKAAVYLIVTYKDGQVDGPDEVSMIDTKEGWKVQL